MHALVLSLVLLAEPTAGLPPEEIAKRFFEVSVEERRAALAAVDKAQQQAVLEQLPPDKLIDFGLKVVEELGTYSGQLVKQERVDDELIDAQTIDLVIREKPFAVRALYVAGPKAGRKVLYSSTIRPKELRVREAGLLGIAGAIWIGLDSGLSRGDTNHPITNLGLTSLLTLMKRDIDASKPHGGQAISGGGFDALGRYCAWYTAPKGAKGLYAAKVRTCYRPETGLLEYIEVHDAKGLLEKYTWRNVKKATVAEDYFTLDGAGL